ncbi:carotenoid-cleaving dioxygenase, mitochondrial-like [Argiope bruennichi]|uniref:carotenoid-cleaving dioxygenase, mitochondrial-like n=1 Tax=Argiope bruennichi TaxID=94029 RepID=UPI002493D3C7|nr:carotenoid-cleaving dioxygenase, mitochondrial-like [Argiope bruennichi]
MEKLFQTVEQCPELQTTEITGILPDWLKGELFLIGPGKWDFDEDFTVNHWLDGSAFMYKFNISKNHVDVMSRFLDTVAYNKVCQVKRPVFVEFGTKAYPDQEKNVFSRYLSHLVPLELSDNVMANVFIIDDELYASSETCHVWKINPTNLKCEKRIDLRDLVSVNLASSHPHICPDGSVYNLCASFMTGLRYHVMKLNPRKLPAGEKGFERGASIMTTISSSQKTTYSYYHSFALSENYILFLKQPLLVNTVKMAASGIKGYCVRDCLEWTPTMRTKLHLIERRTGKEVKVKFEADTLFFFHHINAYEDGTHLVVDIMAFPNSEVMDKFFLKDLRAGRLNASCKAIFTRFVIPLLFHEGKPGKNLVTLKDTQATAVIQENGVIFLTPETKGEAGYDMPTINYSMYNSKKYRYAYGSGSFDTGKFANSLIKLDTVTGEMKVWKGTETMFPSELSYVPRPRSLGEDDGVLLSVVLDVADGTRDFLMVIHAKTFEELGRAYIPRSVKLPPSVHARFRMH